MTWWEDFWTWAETSQLGSNVVGGVIGGLILSLVLLFVSIFKKSWRTRIWGNVVRFFQWVTTIRITTTARQAKMIKDAPPTLNNVIQAAQEARAAREAEAAREEASRALTPVAPSLPPAGVKPRWRVRHVNPMMAPLSLMLQNLASENSRPRNVRLEASAVAFEFHSAADWSEIPGGTKGDFRGYATEGGRHFGVDFEVHWYDDDGQEHVDTASLAPQRSPF